MANVSNLQTRKDEAEMAIKAEIIIGMYHNDVYSSCIIRVYQIYKHHTYNVIAYNVMNSIFQIQEINTKDQCKINQKGF